MYIQSCCVNMELAVKLLYFGIFCFFWYCTPFSTWVLDSVVYMIPRSLDASIGNAGASSQRYRIVHKYNDRLSKIGTKLISALPSTLTSGYQFSFHCIDEKFVNAFAYPGGKIYITDELIQDLQVTDDEIAAVLAHEIGHVVHRHSIKGLIEPGIVAIAWQAIFYVDDDDHKESFGEAIGEILVKNAALIASLSFSRAHEYEADMEGWTALMNSAGYNPVGMITLFEKLLQLEPEGDGLTHWDKTHPGTKDRISKLLGYCGKKCDNRNTPLVKSGNRKQPKADSCQRAYQNEINGGKYTTSNNGLDRGICQYKDGKYEGEFKDDKKHGRGVYRYTSGAVYEGEFKDDKRHGRGVYRYASGDVYEGEFKDGNFHGQGVYSKPNGSK